MFDPTKSLAGRLADAIDLVIDFTTLGEYGLEPVGRTPRGCEVDGAVLTEISAARDGVRQEIPAVRDGMWRGIGVAE